jgi:hypothetical protein
MNFDAAIVDAKLEETAETNWSGDINFDLNAWDKILKTVDAHFHLT